MTEKYSQKDALLRNLYLRLRLRRNKAEPLKFSGAGMSDMGGDLVSAERVQGAERAGLDRFLNQTTVVWRFADNTRT